MTKQKVVPKAQREEAAEAKKQRKQAEGGEEQEDEGSPLCNRIMKIVVWAVLILICIFAAIGEYVRMKEQQENGEDGSSLDDDDEDQSKNPTRGMFAVPSTCSPQQLHTVALSIVRNFSRVVDKIRTSSDPELVANLESLVGNEKARQEAATFSSRKATLNYWLERLIIAMRRMRGKVPVQADPNKASDSDEVDDSSMEEVEDKSPGFSDLDNPEMETMYSEKDEEERLAHLTFSLIRWAKGVRSFLGSVEKFCDVESLLKKSVPAVPAAAPSTEQQEEEEEEAGRGGGQDHGVGVASAKKKTSSSSVTPEIEAAPEKEKHDQQEAGDDEGSAEITMAEFIDTQVLPVLYRDTIRLLNFSYSYHSEQETQSEQDLAVEKKKLKNLMTHLIRHDKVEKDVSEQLTPFRDVVLRTMMSLSDLSFVLEREDYHTAFVSQLVRLTDGVAAVQTERARVYKTAATKPNPSKKDLSVQLSDDNWPSCTHWNARLFCSTRFPTKLVSARPSGDDDAASATSSSSSSASEDDNASHQMTPDYLADDPGSENIAYVGYLFSLLRSAYMEELIALHSTNVAIRTAYGFSLFELQKYETGKKALEAAERAISRDAAAASEAEQDDSALVEARKRYRERQTGIKRVKKNKKKMEEGGAGGAGGEEDDDDKPDFSSLSLALNCLEKEKMLEYVSELQQRYNLQVPMRFTQLLKKCKEFVDREDASAGSSQTAKAVKRKTLTAAVSIDWPLPQQKINGKILSDSELGQFDEEAEEPESFPLLLT